MNNIIKKIFGQASLQQNPDNEYILSEIRKTMLALETAYSNFDNVTDHDLVDSCIYELNAVQSKYRYLLNKFKEK